MAEAEQLEGTFIDVEVSGEVANDTALATKLEEVCPVDIFDVNESDGSLAIARQNLDECVLCNLCVEAAPARRRRRQEALRRHRAAPLGMTSAEDLARTDSEVAALQKLREVTGESGGAMERHGLRVFLIADRLATARELKVDREVLLIAGLLHDVGLYDAASHGGVYVTEGAEFTAELLREHGWGDGRIKLCFDAIERHHELRSQWDRGPEVELIRRADLVDLSDGLIRFGLSREWIHDLFKSVSRDGTYRTIGYEVARVIRHRPLTLPQIFRR